MADKPTYEELESRVKDLEKKEKELSQIFSMSLDLVCIADIKTATFIKVNPAFIEALGYSEEELLGKSFLEFVHSEDIDATRTVVEKKLQAGAKVINFENRYLCKDGSYRWLSWVSQPIIKEGVTYAVARDITTYKQIEDTLSQSEEKFRTLVDQAADMLVVHDIEGNIMDVNQASINSYGYSREELLSMKVVDLDPDYIKRDNSRRFWDRFGMNEPFRFEARQKRKDGTIFPVEVILTKLIINEQLVIMGLCRDISDRKKAENALKEQTATLNNILDKAADGICVCHNIPEAPYVSFTHWNPRMTEITGYTMDEINEFGWYQALYPDPEIRRKAIDRMSKMRAGDNINAEEWTVAAKDGTKKALFISTSVLKEQRGKVHVLATMQEITEHKRIEQEKLEAQKIAADHEKYALVGQIAGKMAHDFNNILAGILGNAQLELLKEKEERSDKTLDLIVESALRGKNLTKNLVAFAKDQEPEQEYFSINEKINLVLELLKKDLEGIVVTRELSPKLQDLLADPGMIEHGLVNIIQNAIHATSKAERPAIRVRTYSNDNHINIEVEDNGCGIPEESIARIYEPAFTLKGSKDTTGSYKTGIKGTGYGMCNVKKYIDQHKGNISIDSEVGKGTKITISLPVIEKELSEKEITEIGENRLFSGKRILLVEDEPAICDVQYRILTYEPCSHMVDVAANGQAAIDLINRYEYDLVSLDFVLPDSINGMDVYNHIRENTQTLPVLFISGNLAFLESIKELKQKDPLVDHVSKPCENKEYVLSINKLIRSGDDSSLIL